MEDPDRQPSREKPGDDYYRVGECCRLGSKCKKCIRSDKDVLGSAAETHAGHRDCVTCRIGHRMISQEVKDLIKSRRSPVKV